MHPFDPVVPLVPIRFRTSFLHYVFLAAAIFLTVGSNSVQAQISPGPLSVAHQSLTGTTQCATCHQFGASTPTFKCLDCHKEIAQHLSANSGYQARLGMKNPSGKDCVRCHLEHNGSGSQYNSRTSAIGVFTEFRFTHSHSGL